MALGIYSDDRLSNGRFDSFELLQYLIGYRLG